MSGAEFFLKALETFNGMENDKRKLDQNQQRIDLANRTSTQNFELGQQRLAISERQMELAESKWANVKEKEQAMQEYHILDRQSQRVEQQEKERQQEYRRQTAAFQSRIFSGEAVDVTSLVFGPNVDPAINNVARGNSGRGGNIISKLDKETNEMLLFTRDNESGELLPYTVDPTDNSSPQLRIPKENFMESLYQVTTARNQIEQTDETGEMMGQFFNTGMGLVVGEDGRTTTKRFYDQESQLRKEYEAQQLAREADTGQGRATDAPEATGERPTPFEEDLDTVKDTAKSAFIDMHPINMAWKAGKKLFGDEVSHYFTGKTLSEHEAEEVEAKVAKAVEGKDPQQAEEITFREYAKAQGLGASDAVYLAKMRPGAPKAVNASRRLREKAMDRLIESGFNIPAEKRRAYEETGTTMTKAEMQKAGFEQAKDYLDFQKKQLEVSKMLREQQKGETFADRQEAYEPIKDWVKNAYLATGQYGGKGGDDRLKADTASYMMSFDHFLTSGNIPFDSLDTAQLGTVISTSAVIHSRFADEFREMGKINPSLSLAMASINPKVAQRFGNLNSDEDIENFVRWALSMEQQTGASLDRIGAEMFKIE